MRELKKYPNRRIYDTTSSKFITLAEVRDFVIDRETFRVVHSKTGEDLTRNVLLQVIAELEDEGHESLLTNRILEELIRFYGDSTVGVMAPFLERQILRTLATHDELRRRLSKALTFPSPEQTIRKMLDRYLALAEPLLPGSSDPKESGKS